MKIRNGFVTNSSSSSFVVAFKDKEDGINQIIKELKESPESLGVVLSDFINAEPYDLNKIKATEDDEYGENIIYYLESEASDELMYSRDGFYWEESDFVKNWMKNNPDKSRWEIYNSPEYKEAIKNLMGQKIEEFIDGLKNKPYVVELEYEDHTRIGSELEHDILPYCNFVYQVFNHH